MTKKNKELFVIENEEKKDAVKWKDNEGFTLIEVDLEEQVRTRRRRGKIRRVIIITLLFASILGVYLFVTRQTFTTIRVINTAENKSKSENSYQSVSFGMLKISKEGVSLLDLKGREKWNQPYQMREPITAVNGETAAVADKGGNDIVVVSDSGLIGEITTPSPIEQITISQQGIVCAVMRSDDVPEMTCYDLSGNVLVKHKTSISHTGYPVGSVISDDGKGMIVSYVMVENPKMTSKIIYYSFAGEKDTTEGVKQQEIVMEDTIAPSIFLMDNDRFGVVGDHQLAFFKGRDTVKEIKTVEIKNEIVSVTADRSRVLLVVRQKDGFSLNLYDSSGRLQLEQEISRNYGHIKLVDEQIIMYDGIKCQIYSTNGIEKFNGEANKPILEMIPVFGLNKYIMMTSSGMEEVRLTK
ncbi:hypothetical protein M2454_000811 [Aequitasia blattaphilus]|uniref:DUF5711 family protein n=1 Tax=Aequitasia blattaphilus TaxID=2949332 RepID=A0ABT1E9S5_9FIRM|nr:DUF5711 family protein [Aequitasia blattaphilus]MCP1102580.1 DUF5711 family protein [Aequitasia blattaphilus]MCR8615220.1 DUF5711 family protein [Aequitasia blattaphilus]